MTIDLIEHLRGYNAKAGLIDTFIGPIADQDGVIRIAEGEFWGNDKMGNWDWLIEGMIGEAQ